MDSTKKSTEVPAIINFLTELSCCSRCIVRFLGINVAENEPAYKNSKEYLNQLLTNQIPEETENINGSSAKKLKPNICPVCLNCFEQNIIEKSINCFGSLGIKDYKYNNFFFNVSFPKCLAIRAHSMLLHLKKNFPEFSFGNLYEKKTVTDTVLEQPHKIFRISASEYLAKALDKQCHPKSNLSLLISFAYENDHKEVENMRNIIKKKNVKVSRNNIPEFLKDVSNNLFRENFPVPPEVPNEEVLLEKVDVTADPLYLGGRYLKFQRNVGQTPWVVDGVSVAEHNVQDIIFDAIYKVLGCRKEQMTFTASGREDVDVRMLGTGRPFYIKIDNPKQRQFTAEQFLEVEKQVIKSERAAVIKLQTVYSSELKRIKFGEEHKLKTYRALCKTTAPDIEKALSIINNQKELTLSQLTVMRVLHRRTLMSRDKVIHKMSAVEVPGHNDLFVLEVVTQAGTYVKEFVHGDFDRTRPSISSILGYHTDLVALDCVEIALIWPEDVPNSTSNDNDM